MIYVLYGEDDFSKREALENIKGQIGQPEVRDANTTLLAALGLTLGNLQHACAVVPFLAERRLVIVEGLLAHLGGSALDRRQARPSPAKALPEGWQSLPAALAQIPDSTLLVFIEGALRSNNPLLKEVASAAQVKTFPQLRREELEKWIRQKVAGAGISINQDALQRLADLLGPNLWALQGEIEKLVLYAGNKTINKEAVELLVAYARETNIFRAVDAILLGQSANAMRLIGQMRQSGAEVSYIITMLARQLRLILLTQEFLEQKLPRREMAQRLGLTAEFAVRQTEEQARHHPYEQVATMYRRLLATDLAIKRGQLGEALALETLVLELCQGSSDPELRPSRSGFR